MKLGVFTVLYADLPLEQMLDKVAAIQDRWRIDDEWWRAPISRLYYQLLLEGGLLLTVFCDLRAGGWYLQHAGAAQRLTHPTAVLVPRPRRIEVVEEEDDAVA